MTHNSSSKPIEPRAVPVPTVPEPSPEERAGSGSAALRLGDEYKSWSRIYCKLCHRFLGAYKLPGQPLADAAPGASTASAGAPFQEGGVVIPCRHCKRLDKTVIK